jgi:hypothetical protein
MHTGDLVVKYVRNEHPEIGVSSAHKKTIEHGFYMSKHVLTFSEYIVL